MARFSSLIYNGHVIKTLLQTKLYIPPVQPSLVPRPRLIEQLNAGLGENRAGFARKLTLASAPAGYGKTTLIVDWLTQSTSDHLPFTIHNSCWLSLDEDDNDPAQFWTYAIAALQTVDAQLGKDILPILRASQPADLSPLITSLINQIVTSDTTQHRLVLALDDYHVIHNRAVHETMAFWLAHMPPQIHLVIITRADPPLPLSRLRARGQLTEVREAELRFTETETAVFLNQIMHLGLSPEDVAALEARTEGWIASLQLAALAMQSPAIQPQDRHNFIATFTGNDRYIVDYLVEEVLQQQPPPIKEFLLKTAILERLCGSLCDAVLGGEAERQRGGGADIFSPASSLPRSSAILEHLDAASLFLIPLDNRRNWYRYHHLFRDLLRYRLHETYPEGVAELHHRASRWFEQNDYAEEAITHALAAEAFERAARLIEHHAHDLFSNGKLMRLHHWLGALPDDFILTRPQLYLVYGWLLLRTGQRQALEALLQHPPGADEETLAAELLVFRAHIAFFRGDFAASIRLIQRALSLLLPGNLPVRAATMNQLARSYGAAGDAVSAIEQATEAVKLGQQVNSLAAILAGLGHLVQLFAEQGQLAQARATFDQAIEFAAGRGGSHLPLLGPAYIGLGQVSYRQGDLKGAIQHLREGITRCRQWGGVMIFSALKGYRILVQALQTQGDTEQTAAMLIEAAQLGRQNDMPAWAMSWVETQSVASPPTLTPLESLTEREHQILRLMTAGLSNREIAAELVIAFGTVRTHVKRIYSKLDVHSRHEAITRARELNLV